MRFLMIIISVLAISSYKIASAQSPPYPIVTITGETNKKFNKVCLFSSGGSKEPFKTQYISEHDGYYSIDINIPDDMLEKENYFFSDMRFWGDRNDNGIRDQGEPISECHFIIWVPSAQMIYMQVYKGPKYQFESPILDYNYD